MQNSLSLLEEWEQLDFNGPQREGEPWLEALVEQYPRLNALCEEYRKPMTLELELALLRVADGK